MSGEVVQTDWLDGPGLVRWLEEHDLFSADIQLGFHARAVRRWRAGGAAEVYVADKVLTKLDHHLHELPDDLWLEAKPTGRRYTDAEKYEMARRLQAGEESRSIARTLGCHHKTVEKSLTDPKGAGE